MTSIYINNRRLAKTIFCCVIPMVIATYCAVAQEDVRNSLVSEVKFDAFRLFVYPSYNLSKLGYSLSESSFHRDPREDGNQKAIVAWTSKDVTIITIDRHILIGSKHFQIPDSCSEVWLIGDLLVGIGSGIIPATEIPPDLGKDIEANREDCTEAVFGVVFTVKKALIHGESFTKTDDKNYNLIIGGCFFRVSRGNLEFRGKDYGTINSGDAVVVDERGRLSVLKKKVLGSENGAPHESSK